MLLSSLVITCSFYCSGLHAQSFKRTAVTEFNLENGLLQNTVRSVVADVYGFVWFATGAGVQKFDGTRMETISFHGLQNSLININAVDDDKLWISHGNGITAYNPHTNKCSVVYNIPASGNKLNYRYAGQNSNCVYYLDNKQSILVFDKKAGKLIDKIPFPPLERSLGFAVRSCMMGETVLAIVFNRHVFFLNLETRNIQCSYQRKDIVTGVMSYSTDTILLVTNAQYVLLNYKTGKERIARNVEDGADEQTYVSFERSSSGNLLAGYNKNVYELEPVTFAIKTKHAGFNQEYLVNSGFITGLYMDRLNQLWVLTNSDGVKRINLDQQPFEYYGTATRAHNFTRCIYVDKKTGHILAGSYGSGILVFDTSGYLVKHTHQLEKGVTEIVAIDHLEGDKYLVVALSIAGMYIYDVKTGKATPVFYASKTGEKKRQRSTYYGGLFRIDKNTFLFIDHSVLKFKVSDGMMTDTISIEPYFSQIYSHVLTKSGQHCFATENGLDFFSRDFKLIRRANFTKRITVRCMTEDAKGNIWLGTETGLYKSNTSGQLLKEYSKENGLPDDGIYAIQPFDSGIYFSHNKGISALDFNDALFNYSKHAGLQENEFNTKSTFKTADGKIYFGGVNGITAFIPKPSRGREASAKIYITGIEVMNQEWKDTAVWNIRDLKLPYDKNIIALRLGVPGSTDQASHIYEYKLEGLEPNWISTSGTDYIRYVLPPGKYTFRARLISGKMETQFRLDIAAPFWQRWWFRIMAGAIVLLILIYSIHLINRRKYLASIRQLNLERTLQAERERISRDLHDNLGAYATAIADNADKIARNPSDSSRLVSLRENSSDIINNLRDTIWALNKDQVSTTRLIDRIKNCLQKMRDAYPHIKIELKDRVVTDLSFSPEYALNILRIIQEAFHNALRHSNGNQVALEITVDKKLSLRIQDNGIGLPGDITNGNGFGNMQVRAKENNLQLKIHSDANMGTVIELF